MYLVVVFSSIVIFSLLLSWLYLYAISMSLSQKKGERITIILTRPLCQKLFEGLFRFLSGVMGEGGPFPISNKFLALTYADSVTKDFGTRIAGTLFTPQFSEVKQDSLIIYAYMPRGITRFGRFGYKMVEFEEKGSWLLLTER